MKIDLRNKQAADFYATTYCYEEKRNLFYHECMKVRSPVIIFSIWLETVLTYSDERKCKRPNLNWIIGIITNFDYYIKIKLL